MDWLARSWAMSSYMFYGMGAKAPKKRSASIWRNQVAVSPWFLSNHHHHQSSSVCPTATTPIVWPSKCLSTLFGLFQCSQALAVSQMCVTVHLRLRQSTGVWQPEAASRTVCLTIETKGPARMMTKTTMTRTDKYDNKNDGNNDNDNKYDGDEQESARWWGWWGWMARTRTSARRMQVMQWAQAGNLKVKLKGQSQWGKEDSLAGGWWSMTRRMRRRVHLLWIIQYACQAFGIFGFKAVFISNFHHLSCNINQSFNSAAALSTWHLASMIYIVVSYNTM